MKKLFSLLFVAMLAMTAWGTTVTFVPGNPLGTGTAASDNDATMTLDGVTITSTKGAFGRTDNFRFGAGATITFTSTVGNITKVEITSTASYGSQYGPHLISGTGYSAQSGSRVGTWEGNAASFTLTASAQARASEIVVTIADTPAEELVDPVFTPGDGTEFDVASLAVTVSCATPDADIYVYNVVDGEIDWAGGYQYYFHESGEFYVTQTSSYAAYATKGSDYTDYVYATYTKVLPTCAAPTFTPATGATFEDYLDVTIDCGTPGATITYTVNDDIYEDLAPVVVTLTETATITAVATCDGYQDSQEVSASYTKLAPYNVGGIVEFVALTDTVEGGTNAGWHTIVKDNVTMKFYGTVSNYQLTDTLGNVTAEYHQYRIYKNNTIQFTTAAGNIRKIEFICDPTNPVNGFNAIDGLDMTTGIWEGNTRDITFTAGSKQVRANSIIVTLDDEAPAVVVADPVIDPETNTRFAGSQVVTITCETTEADVYYAINDGDYQLYQGAFTLTESATVKAYAEYQGVQSNIVTAKYIKLAEVNTIAEANALENKTDFIFYGNVVVVYQNGSNLWVKDNTGYGLIYGSQVPQNIPVGSTLAEEWDAQYYQFRGHINEYQFPNNVEVTDAEPVEIVATEYAEADLTEDNINERVILKGLTLTAGTDAKYLYTADGMAIYNQFNITYPTLEEGKTYDVEGMVSYYSDAVQIMPISVTESQTVEILLGDVNGDGVINPTDATVLINALLNENYSAIVFDNSDMDANGTVNVTDAILLINMLLTL